MRSKARPIRAPLADIRVQLLRFRRQGALAGLEIEMADEGDGAKGGMPESGIEQLMGEIRKISAQSGRGAPVEDDSAPLPVSPAE